MGRPAPTRRARYEAPSLPSIGVIIPLRNRSRPLHNALASLFYQSVRPKWVTVSDLESDGPQAGKAETLCARYEATYLKVRYPGKWNKGLTFNTALKRSSSADFVMQVDVDVVLRPDAIELLSGVLKTWEAAVSVPVNVDVPEGSFRPSPEWFKEQVSRGQRMSKWSVGGCVVFPREWLLRTRGIDEAYTGWGNQDMDLWDRAQKELRTRQVDQVISLHQAHAPQPDFFDKVNRKRNLDRRVSQWRGAGLPVNPDVFGEGEVLHEAPCGNSKG